MVERAGVARGGIESARDARRRAKRRARRQARRRITRRYSRREALSGIAFVLPSLIGCTIMVLAPFTDAVRRSMHSGLQQTFVGLDNYRAIFQNASFLQAAGNTARFIAICLPLLIALSLLLAVLLNGPVFKRSALRASFLLPLAIPVASVALLWQILFHQNGLMNNLLELFGAARVDWMRTDWALGCLVLSYLWKNVGYNMVLFLAGLSGISPALYEAASVDGANSGQQFRYITLPGLMPTLFTVTVLALLSTFKAYREAWLIAGNYPQGSIYLLQHTLNNWFTALDMEKLSAAATVIALVILALVALLNFAWTREAGEDA